MTRHVHNRAVPRATAVGAGVAPAPVASGSGVLALTTARATTPSLATYASGGGTTGVEFNAADSSNFGTGIVWDSAFDTRVIVVEEGGGGVYLISGAISLNVQHPVTDEGALQLMLRDDQHLWGNYLAASSTYIEGTIGVSSALWLFAGSVVVVLDGYHEIQMDMHHDVRHEGSSESMAERGDGGTFLTVARLA